MPELHIVRDVFFGFVRHFFGNNRISHWKSMPKKETDTLQHEDFAIS
jgi:hypothetical protein